MKRRGFLKLLGLLPFAPALAEAAAKTICPERIISLDKALTGSDQTSIWLTQWKPQPSFLDVANKYTYNHLPVTEALSQRNTFSREWQDLSDYIMPTRKA